MGAREKIFGRREKAKRRGEPSSASSTKRRRLQIVRNLAHSQNIVQRPKTTFRTKSQVMSAPSSEPKIRNGSAIRQVASTRKKRREPCGLGRKPQDSI